MRNALSTANPWLELNFVDISSTLNGVEGE